MAKTITIDTSSLNNGISKYIGLMGKNTLKSINEVANEILRLSNFEVPHNVGALQTSGSVQPDTDKSVIVGYNKVYAARLHEHPEYRFQKGRKGKYLEDPIKNNLNVFIKYIQDGVKNAAQSL